MGLPSDFALRLHSPFPLLSDLIYALAPRLQSVSIVETADAGSPLVY